MDVLLLEDSPADGERIERMLAGSDLPGFRVATCVTLADGLARLAARKPDVVVADVFLPDSSGLETIMDVLARADQVPVVILTGFPNPELASQAIKMGCEDFLDKEGLDARVLRRSLLYARERRQAYEVRVKLRRQAEEVTRLRQLERLKSEFMNAAAHELRTPLTPIRLQLEVLKRAAGGGPDAQRRSLQVLERNFDRLGKLVQDLLEVARLQAGRLELQAGRADIAALVRDAVESFEPMAQSRGVRLVTQVPPGLAVRGDGPRLSQVVYNLVSNALKFTPAGGEVRIEAARRGDEVRVAVRDTGLGLSAEQVGRLFQPFTQVHQRQGVAEGTGLGLFVSRGIVELHGGRLDCQSDGPGQGTTFTMVLAAPDEAAGLAGAAAGEAVAAEA